MLTNMADNRRRTGSETLEFTVKGPVSVSLDEDDVSSPGCSVLDLQFSSPSQVGELVFRNYYTAWLTVLTRCRLCKGNKLSEETGGWTVAVPRRVLMPDPHLETGSHDSISISATESLVDWKSVVTIRLVLRQPSPIWRSFHVEELNVFHNLPRRVPRSLHNSDQQYDTLLGLVQDQTLTALHWIPEPKDSASVTDNSGPCGYEFFNLPQI